MKRKHYILLLIPIILFTVITIFIFSSPSINHGKVYDSDTLIRRQENQSRFGSYVIDREDNFSISGFSGVVDIYYLIIDTEHEVLSYSCDIELKHGLFKVVLVTENGEVITLTENGSAVSQTIDIPQGKNRIKIVGKNANVDFTFSPTSSTDAIKIEKSKF